MKVLDLIRDFEREDGVYLISKFNSNNAFEKIYTKLRTNEGRIYKDETVRKFPEISKDHKLYKEWQIRKHSTEKLITYLNKTNNEKSILDFGCGNGWMSNKLSQVNNVEVLGMDINMYELTQAARVFNRDNLLFAYGNLHDLPDTIKFDYIILAGVIGYVEDLKDLLDKLFAHLNRNGEIHLLDNIFYINDEHIKLARKNSLKHFTEMNSAEMSSRYFYHKYSDLDSYNPEILYNPNLIFNKIRRKVFNSDISPFFWFRLKK